jgi:hypothetical protein
MEAAKREKFKLKRPRNSTERSLLRFALNPQVRKMVSPALNRPMKPGQVYITNGKYVHYVLASPKSFTAKSFRMNPPDVRGIRTVMASPPGTWDDVAEKPRSSPRLQSIMVPMANFEAMKRSFERNPLLMTVTNPGYKKNPVDVEYEAGSKMYRVYRTNPGWPRHAWRCHDCGGVFTTARDVNKHQRETRDSKQGMHVNILEFAAKRPLDLRSRSGIKRSHRTNPKDEFGRKLYGPSRALTFKPKIIRLSGPKGQYAHYQKSSPDNFDPRSFRTISMGVRGTKGVVGCPKGEWDPRRKRCKVGLRLQKVMVPKSRLRTRARSAMRLARNPAVPLWNNPVLGRIPMEENPMDVALATMPVYDDNPCSQYCNNPEHGHGTPWPEQAGFGDNPGGIPAAYAGMFNDNPENPLTSEETREILDSSQGWEADSARHAAGGNLNAAFEAMGRAREDVDIARKYHWSPNPGGFEVGDYVRNKSVVMKYDGTLDLEAGSMGRIEEIRRFMGDDLFLVTFYNRPGGARTFKFFAKDIAKEPNQLRFDENPYSPAQPRALQRAMPSDGRPPKYGSVNALHRQPHSRTGVQGYAKGSRRIKIPLAKFESWLRSHGSPEEIHRYKQSVTAYKRFHKGALPEFVTRKIVDVGAGKKLLGRSFAYSMGKSPFEPYVTPRGSGKGANKAYLHEYETMPEGVTVPSGKVVIKPLEGKTHISDWIHR